MAAAIPQTDITEMLGSLMEIICKYEEKDPENMPNQGDYLLAMNTLKALNDRKGNFTSVQRQVVIQLRDRIRRVPNILEITNRHAGWMMKKLREYVTCDVCGSQLVDEYSLNRHKKRQNCRTSRARTFFFSQKFQQRMARWAARGFPIDFPFVAAMFQLHENTRPQILILPDPAAREFTWPKEMIPRRILPRALWESMWSATAQGVNPRFCFKYEPEMFCHKLQRDGKNGFSHIYRHSIITQSATIYISSLDQQHRLATSMLRSNPNGARLELPRQLERLNLNVEDRQPMLKMTIAPEKRPRFRCVPELMNAVAGANPMTNDYAEVTGFSSVVAPAPVQNAGDADADAESESDDSEVSVNI